MLFPEVKEQQILNYSLELLERDHQIPVVEDSLEQFRVEPLVETLHPKVFDDFKNEFDDSQILSVLRRLHAHTDCQNRVGEDCCQALAYRTNQE